MNEQRELAIAEQLRKRINNAMSYIEIVTTVPGILGDLEIGISMEYYSNRTDISISTIKNLIHAIGTKYANDNPTFEVMSDDIFTDIATLYPELEVEVTIFTKSNIGFSKIYKTSTPL